MSFRPIPNQTNSGLVEVGSNIWTIEAKGCIHYRPPMQPSYPYTHREVVIRLNDNSLLVISPIELTSELRNDLDRLGTVKYLVSPNHLHHLYLGQWQQAYPNTKLYASPGLASKRKDLSFDKIFHPNDSELEWSGQIEQCIFGSGKGWLDEVVFFHCEWRTVIFTDLIMDFEPKVFDSISRVTTKWNKMYRNTPRGVRLVRLFDKRLLRNVLKTIRNWKPEHLIVAHSPWLCVDGEEPVAALLNSAFSWLKPQPAIAEAILSVGSLLILLLIIMPIHSMIVLVADIIYPKFANVSK